MKYARYAWYVIRHKWFVLVECWRRGLIWRGLTHDLSKFRPSEFIPYARYFYGGSYPLLMDTHGDERMAALNSWRIFQERVDADFDLAWLRHQKRNDHHWQWWILPEDDGGEKIIEMAYRARKEMLCDWHGAGRAQGTPDTKEWYLANDLNMRLGGVARMWIEDELGCSIRA